MAFKNEPNLSPVINDLTTIGVDTIRSIALGPRDRFERGKKRLVLLLLVPVTALLVANPIFSVLVSLLGDIELVKRGQEIKINVKIVSSDDVLYIAGMIVVAFIFTLLCNLIYAMHMNKIELLTKDLERRSGT
jgi:hypothetical protein